MTSKISVGTSVGEFARQDMRAVAGLSPLSFLPAFWLLFVVAYACGKKATK